MPLRPARHHPFDLTPAAARELQTRLAGGVERDDRFGPVGLVAGVDIGFEAGGRITRAAVAVLALPGLDVVDTAVVRRATAFPYVPGLLSFREIPAAVDALGAIATTPDLLLCDGQGLAHPRRFGLASHLGWLLDVPCIGVAKSRLVGTHDEPGPARGETAALCDRDEVIGAVLRTRTGARPVFVSTGHRVGLASAVALTLACTSRYRLPETTRAAHRLASPPGGRGAVASDG